MTLDQTAILAVLAAVIVLFVWDRLRADVVSLLALMSAVVLGLVPADAAFAGFGPPAVITVAAVLGLSAALNRSGAIDVIATHITRLTDNPLVPTAATCSLGGSSEAPTSELQS